MFTLITSTLAICYIYPLIISSYIEIEKFSIKPTQIYRGQKIIINVTIKNNSILPLLFAKIKINSNHLYQEFPETIFYIKPKQTRELQIELKAKKRGFIQKLQFQLNINLFFEILNPLKKDMETSIYIYPNFAPINYQSLISLSPQNEIWKVYKLAEEGEFFAIREYQMDDVKKISWKHWAKTGKLVVKQKAQFSHPKLYIVINNISAGEEKDEEFVEKINTFLKYTISNNIEVNISSLEKVPEFQKIVDIKNSLVFLSQINFIPSLNPKEELSKTDIFLLTDKNRLSPNLPLPKINI